MSLGVCLGWGGTGVTHNGTQILTGTLSLAHNRPWSVGSRRILRLYLSPTGKRAMIGGDTYCGPGLEE